MAACLRFGRRSRSTATAPLWGARPMSFSPSGRTPVYSGPPRCGPTEATVPRELSVPSREREGKCKPSPSALAAFANDLFRPTPSTPSRPRGGNQSRWRCDRPPWLAGRGRAARPESCIAEMPGPEGEMTPQPWSGRAFRTSPSLAGHSPNGKPWATPSTKTTSPRRRPSHCRPSPPPPWPWPNTSARRGVSSLDAMVIGYGVASRVGAARVGRRPVPSGLPRDLGVRHLRSHSRRRPPAELDEQQTRMRLRHRRLRGVRRARQLRHDD